MCKFLPYTDIGTMWGAFVDHGFDGFSPCLSNGLQDALNYRSKQKYRQPDHDGTGRGSEDENSWTYEANT